MIRQGEIRYLTQPSRQLTVVVISGDEWNNRLPPLVAPILRGLVDRFPVVVALHETDPYAGGIALPHLGTVDVDMLGTTVHGVLGGQTMQRLRDAITAMVEG